jgi:hypothetical protein
MGVGAWTIEVDPGQKALIAQVWDLRSDEHIERQRQADRDAVRRPVTERWRWLHQQLMLGAMPLLSEPMLAGACQHLERQMQQWCERWQTRYREVSTLIQLPITR